MGLFGYGKSDFDRSTEEFKSKLMSIMEEGKPTPESGKVINQTLVNLDFFKMPDKANKKEVQAIDERIRTLLGKIRDDIQAKKPELFAAHVNILASAVADARKFGKELLTSKELEAEEITAVCKAQLFEAITLKEQNTAKMANLLQEAKRNPAKMERIKIEYNDLASKTQNIDSQIGVITARHNANIKILNTRDIGKTYQELPPQIASVQDFSREVAKINEMAAKEAGYVEGINDAANDLELNIGGGVSTSSAFDDAFSAAQMQDFDSAISGANVNVSGGSESAFDAVFGQKK
ncbi:MAG: hypothetical protein J6V71_00355 [Clostridia bacterium]|nr:hypothetical protein [Clostridia bacterium]